MNKVIEPLQLNIGRFKREFSRLSKMTTFERAMDKAIDIKADRWLDYRPLSREQLFDSPQNINAKTTIVVPFGGQLSHARSTYRGTSFYGQKTILARPTETLALLHALGMYIIETDFVVVRQEPGREERFCIICKTSHAVADFVVSKRYLNNLSFACKRALAEGKREIWRYAA